MSQGKVGYSQYTYSVLSLVSSSVKPVLAAFFELPFIRERLPLAPASGRVRYHHAYEGGLLDHIASVQDYALKLAPAWTLSGITKNDVVLTSLLHDLHKLADPRGNPYYVDNMLKKGRSEAEPYKHGEAYNQSVFSVPMLKAASNTRYEEFLLNRIFETGKGPCGGDCSLALVYDIAPELYSHLTADQIFAIRYHDGAYAHSIYDGDFQGKETPLQIILHCADMLSSREERNNASTPI